MCEASEGREWFCSTKFETVLFKASAILDMLLKKSIKDGFEEDIIDSVVIMQFK